MGSVTKYMEKKIPGVYVHSLMIGDNVVQDTENGFFLNINKQIDLVCQMVNNDEKLKSKILFQHQLLNHNFASIQMATTPWASLRAAFSCEVLN